MWHILRHNPRAFYWSLGLHVFFALLFFVGVKIDRPITEAGSKARVVQATIIGDAALEAMVAEFQAEQARRPAGPEISPEIRSGVDAPPDAVAPPESSQDDLSAAEAARLEAELTEAERQADAEREEAQRLEEAALAAAEAERLAAEAEAAAAEAEARRLLEIDRMAEAQRQAQAEREAAEARAEAEQRADAERRAEAARRAEAERLAAEAAAAKAEAERLAEEQRLAAEAAARAEAQRRSEAVRAEDERRERAEAERRAEIERRVDAQRQADAEAALARQRQLEEEARLMAELEERRLVEELAQERIEQEARRLAEEDRQRGLGAEEAQRTREGDPSSALATAQLAREADSYKPVIKDRVRQFWVRPMAAERDLETMISLRLIPGGDVVPNSVRIIKRSGNTAFDQSVVAAVYRASPFPVPSGPLFDRYFREIDFTFRP